MSVVKEDSTPSLRQSQFFDHLLIQIIIYCRGGFEETQAHQAMEFFLFFLATEGVKELGFARERGIYPFVSDLLSSARLSGYLYRRSPSRSDHNYVNESALQNMGNYLRRTRETRLLTEDETTIATRAAKEAALLVFELKRDFRDCVRATSTYNEEGSAE